MGGLGGAASASTAKAVTAGAGYANAAVDQYGGAGGDGRGNAGGGAGAASTLTNAVSGLTHSGTLTLTQNAVGGEGGFTYDNAVAAGNGGAATSSLTFVDTTQAGKSALVNATVSAVGGAGGAGLAGGQDGKGGAAISTAAITGAKAVALTTNAVGGSSDGINYIGYGINGGGGAAAATGTAIGTTDVTSRSIATGGEGVGSSGNASATATGATGYAEADSSATLYAGALVTALNASSNTDLAGDGTTADTAHDVSLSQFGTTVPTMNTSAQGVANITGMPTAANVNTVLAGNGAIASAFAVSPSYFGLAELGGQYSAHGTSSETANTSVSLTVDSSLLATPGDLIVGLYGGVALGSGVTDVTLDIYADGSDVLHQDFASALAAKAYFTNNAVDLGALSGGTEHIQVSLSVTGASAGSGFYGNLLIGDPPAGTVLTGGATAGTLDGSAGHMVVTGGSAGDIIVGGNGDTLHGGAGADAFTFGAHFGQETIYGFTASGGAADTLVFGQGAFDDWAHLLAATKQTGQDLTITLDRSDTLVLKDMSLSAFAQGNVRFH